MPEVIVSGQAPSADEIAAQAVAAKVLADGAAAKAAADAAASAEADKAKTYDQAYVTALRAEAAGHRVKLKEFEAAEDARKQAEMTEGQKLTARAEAAEKRAKELEIQQIRTKAASKHALPDDLHEFITADDEAGALAQAEKLASKLAKPGAGQGAGLPASGGRAPANGGDQAAKLNEAERFGEMRGRVPALNNRVLRN